MENASKALIIAASVLLAILIIAMGVAIFNKVQGAADTSSFDTAEINMFNQKFERYNNNQLGSQVKSLISFAISNASTNKEEPSKLPKVIFKAEKDEDNVTTESGMEASNKNEDYIDDLGKIRNAIISTHTYKVELSYANTGLIGEIKIAY